jgi:hypothetical protein
MHTTAVTFMRNSCHLIEIGARTFPNDTGKRYGARSSSARVTRSLPAASTRLFPPSSTLLSANADAWS